MILKCNSYLFVLVTFLIVGCGNYSFTGASIPEGTKSFQVNLFENNSGNNVGSIFEPGLDRDFTLALQNILENQTNLEMLQSNGDLVYNGEIIEYRVSPMTATANLDAAQNRLTMTVAVNYENTLNDEDNLEKRFSFYYDFPGNLQVYDIKDSALQEIFERILLIIKMIDKCRYL